MIRIHKRPFLDNDGEPIDLPLEASGKEASFARLVYKYAGDVTSRAILDELTHSQTIIGTSENMIRLAEKAYIPDQNELEQLRMLGEHANALLSTALHNINNPKEQHYLERVAYEFLSSEAAALIQKDIEAKSQQLLIDVDKTLTEQKKVTTSSKSKQSRIGVGVYYFNHGVK